MAVAYNFAGPRIVSDGLVLYLDAASPNSYNFSTPLTWRDVSGNGYNFSLVNSPIFESHRGVPCFSFSGAGDRATRSGSLLHDIGTSCTLTIILASINNANFGGCSRLFSINDGSTNNIDYTQYFTTASCDQSKFGLWYKSSPAGLYSTTLLRTVNDDYKMITYKWTASSTASIFINGTQEASLAVTSAFNYLNVQRMTIGMNSSLTQENSTVRVAYVLMYDRELSSIEINENYNALRGRFGL